MIKKKSKHIIDLAGPEGNAFVLMAYAKQYSKQLGLDYKKIIEEMTSGDYEDLAQTFDKYFGQIVILYK